MDRSKQDSEQDQREELENERPGFTPAGRRKDGAETAPSTADRDQPSALGGKVATRSGIETDA